MMKKIGEFFAAMLPFFIFWGVNVVVSTVGIVIAMVVGMVTGKATIADFTTYEGEFAGNSMLIVGTAANICCFIAALIQMKISKVKLDDMRPVKADRKLTMPTVAFTVCMFFVLQVANNIFLKIINVSENDGLQNALLTSIGLSVLVALTAPFVEELVFRGLMVNSFDKRFPKWFSVIVITVVFMLPHSANMRFYALLFGLVLMLLRYRFGDIKLCFIFHFIANGMSCITMLFDDDVMLEKVMYIGAGVGLVLAAVILYIMLKNNPKPVEVDKLMVGDAGVNENLCDPSRTDGVE